MSRRFGLALKDFESVLQELIAGLQDGSIVLDEEAGLSTQLSPSTDKFFVWANSREKAIIELARGNGFASEALAHKKRPTGINLWEIRCTQVY